MLRVLEDEQRPATEEEQGALARWSGWGALPVIFNPRPARAAFGEDEGEQFERAAARWDAVSDLREQIRALLTEDEWAAARRNTINAHYTDTDLVRSIWGAVRGLIPQPLLRGRLRFLEPGCGSGNFIGLAPVLMPVEMTGVEVEPVTAAIARHLYPDAEIITSGLEEVPLADGGFDGVVGNVPFGRYKRFDKVHNPDLALSIHDHFVLKSLYATRPGGIVALITSRYTLDAEKPDARERMYQLGDLVGAVRLPAKAHMGAAGTDVVTDVLFLRRRMDGEEPGDRTWLTSRKRVLPGHENELAVNTYFDAHPEYVLGDLRAGSREWGPDVTVVGRTDQAPADALAAAAAAISVEARAAGLTAAADQRTEPVQTIVSGGTEGALGLDADGNPTIIDGGSPVPLEVHPTQREQLVQLARLKALTLALYAAEADTPEPGETPQLARLRAELRVAWRDYRKSHPPLTKPRQHYKFTPPGAREQATAQGLKDVPEAWKARTAFAWIDDDPDASLLFGLEEWDDRTGKGVEQKVLRARVLEPRTLPVRVNSHEDAIAVAMEYDGGRLDMARVASLLATDEESAAAQCADAGLAYRDPEQRGPEGADVWEPSHRYLSGNVRTKLAAARARVADDPTFQANVAALERVQPADLAPSEIKAKIGAPWVPVDVYNDFLAHLGFEDASVVHAGGTVWEVRGAKNGDLARTEWGTGSRPTQDLFTALLRQTESTIQVTYRDREGRTYVDKAATDEAQEKARLIAEAFEDWVWDDKTRAARLAKTYNELFNNLVMPEYSGSALSLPGLISDWEMREHQNAAIRRIVNEPTALLAHVVGAGKTATMAAGAMELRRTGLAKKPALVVPNHMLKQWSREFRQLYPNAKILTISASDLSVKRRAKFMGRIAGGEWDAVILTHEAFNRVPLRPENMRSYLDRELSSLRSQLDIAAEAGMHRNTVKQIEESLANAEAKLQQQIEAMGDENGVFLEDTGVDYLFLDEAHEYKNLRTVSAIPGAAIQGSAKATKLHMVLDHLRETNESERVATLATGTPIANSVTEAYVLKRYLAPQLLDEMGLDAFDNWAATFGEVVSNLEPDPKGDGYKYKARFARFFNVPELMAAYRTFADVQMAEDLNLPTPPVRENEDGQRGETVLIPPTPAQRQFIKELPHQPWVRKPGGVLKALGEGLRASVDLDLVDATEALRNLGLNITADDISSQDPTYGGRVLDMTKVVDLADAAAVDMRSLGGSKEMGSKIPYAAEKIAEIWQETKDIVYPVSGDDPTAQDLPGGLQLVFLDEGTPGSTAKHGADLYADLRDELVAKGMPRESIRFIHEAGTDRKKEKLFADCRSGRVRVLIGSTQKMGTGTNIQDRAVALHHLSYPWRPADMAQRDGRIERRGNLNAPWIENTPDHVRILYYITERTFDEFRLTTLARKARFIGQIQRKDFSAREIEDIGADAINIGMLAALASGDPAILQLAEATAERARLQGLARSWDRQQDSRSQQLRDIDDFVARADIAREGMRAAAPNRRPTTGDHFVMTVDDATYRSRDAAANALGARMVAIAGDQSVRPGERVPVGTFGGQDFHAEIAYGASGRRQMRLRFAWGYVVPIGQREDRAQWQASSVTQSNGRGAIQSLEHFLNHLDDDLAKLDTSAETLRGRREEIATNLRPKDENPYRIQARSKEREERALGKLVVANEKEEALAERAERAASVSEEAAESVNEELEAMREHIAALRKSIADEHEIQAAARGLAQGETRSGDAPTNAENAEAEAFAKDMADAFFPEGNEGTSPTERPAGDGQQQELPQPEAQDQPGPDAEPAAPAETEAAPSPGTVTPETSGDSAAPGQMIDHDLAALNDWWSTASDEAVPEGHQPFTDDTVRLVAGDRVRAGWRQYMEDRHLHYHTVTVEEGPDPSDGYYVGRNDEGATRRFHPRGIVAVPDGSRLLPDNTPAPEETPTPAPTETQAGETNPLQDLLDAFGGRASVTHIGGTGQQTATPAARLTDAPLWQDAVRALTEGAAASDQLQQAASVNDAGNFALVLARWAEDWVAEQYDSAETATWPQWARLYFAGGEQASADRQRLHESVAADVYPVLRAPETAAAGEGPAPEASGPQAEEQPAPEQSEQEQYPGPSPAMARIAAVLRYYEPLLQRHKLSGKDVVAYIDRPGIGYSYDPDNPALDLVHEIGKVGEKVGGSFRISYNEWINRPVSEQREQQSEQLTNLSLDLITLYQNETEPLFTVDLEAILAAPPGTVIELPSEAQIAAEEAAAARIVIDHDAEGTEVRNTPPGGDQRIRDALNDLGFNWSRRQQKWYQRRDTPFEDRDAAVRGLRVAFENIGVAYTYNGPDPAPEAEENTEAAPQESAPGPAERDTETPETGTTPAPAGADTSSDGPAADGGTEPGEGSSPEPAPPADAEPDTPVPAADTSAPRNNPETAPDIEPPVIVQTPDGPGTVIGTDDGDLVLVTTQSGTRVWESTDVQWPDGAARPENTDRAAKERQNAADAAQAATAEGIELRYGDGNRLVDLDVEAGHGTVVDTDGAVIGWVRARIADDGRRYWWAQDARGGAPDDMPFHEALPPSAGVPAIRAAGSVRSELHAVKEPAYRGPVPPEYAAREVRLTTAQVRELRRLVLDATYSDGTVIEPPEWVASHRKYVLTTAQMQALGDAAQAAADAFPGVTGEERRTARVLRNAAERFEFEVYDTARWRATIPPIGEADPYAGPYQPRPRPETPDAPETAPDAPAPVATETPAETPAQASAGNGPGPGVPADTGTPEQNEVDLAAAAQQVGPAPYWRIVGAETDEQAMLRFGGPERMQAFAARVRVVPSPSVLTDTSADVWMDDRMIGRISDVNDIGESTRSSGQPLWSAEPVFATAERRLSGLARFRSQEAALAELAVRALRTGPPAPDRLDEDMTASFTRHIVRPDTGLPPLPDAMSSDPEAAARHSELAAILAAFEQGGSHSGSIAGDLAVTYDSLLWLSAEQPDVMVRDDLETRASTASTFLNVFAPEDPRAAQNRASAPPDAAVPTVAADPAPQNTATEEEEQLDLFPAETPEPEPSAQRRTGRRRTSKKEPAVQPGTEDGPEAGRLGVYGHAGNGDCDRCGKADTPRYTMVWHWWTRTEDGGEMSAECGSCVELLTGSSYKEYQRQADVAEARRGGRRIAPREHEREDVNVTVRRTAENEWTCVHVPTGKRYRLAHETPSGYRGFVLRDLYGVSQGTGISVGSGSKLAERAALGRTAETHPTDSDDWVFFGYRTAIKDLALHEGESINTEHPNRPRHRGAPFEHGPRWDITVGGTDYQVEMVYQPGQPGNDGHRLEVTAPDGTGSRHEFWDGVLEWAREQTREAGPVPPPAPTAAPLAQAAPPSPSDEQQLDLFGAAAPEATTEPTAPQGAPASVDDSLSGSTGLGLVDGEKITYTGHGDGRYEITLPGTSYLLYLPSITYRRTQVSVALNDQAPVITPQRLRTFAGLAEVMPWVRAHASRRQTGYVFRDGAWTEAPQSAEQEPSAATENAEDGQPPLHGVDDTAPAPDRAAGTSPAADGPPHGPDVPGEESDQPDQEEAVAGEPEPTSHAPAAPAVAPPVEDLPAEAPEEEGGPVVDVEDPPTPRRFTEVVPLAADARYQLRLTSVDGEGPREGELLYGEITVAAVRLSADGRWFARATVDGLPADVTGLTGSPQEAAHQGAIMFAAVTGEPYGEPPVATDARGRLSRADVLRVELRTTAEQHVRTITVAAARANPNYRQSPQFQALSDQLGNLGAADIDNHGSRQMTANLVAVQDAVNAWGGALPADPALDERQHLAFPLLSLLYDTTRLHGRLQATLDAVQADRTAAREQEAAAAAPAEPARNDSEQQIPAPAPDPAPADPPGPEWAADVTSADQPVPLPDAPEDPQMATPARPTTPESAQVADADGVVEPGEEQRPADMTQREGRVERVPAAEPASPAAGEPELPLWTGPEEDSGPEEDRPLDVVADFAAVQEAWDEHVPADKGTGADLFATVEDELQRLEELFADAVAKLNPAAEPQPASESVPAPARRSEPEVAPAPGAPAEPEKAVTDRDPRQSAEAVNVALRDADAHASALQDMPEWQRIQSVRGAFRHLMHVIKERAGEHLDNFMSDNRVGDYFRRLSIRACEKVGKWAQAGAEWLRTKGEPGVERREELPSAEALLRLGDAALTYRGPRRGDGGTPPPFTNGAADPVDVPAIRKMGEALNRPMPGSRRGVSSAAARGRSTTTSRRGEKKTASGDTGQAGHLRRGAAEQPQARKPNQR